MKCSQFLSATMTAAAMLAAFSASAAEVPKNWSPPRLADGHPDLQGNWTNATITPLERPAKYRDRLVLTAAEARELEGAEAAFNAKANAPTDPKTRAEDLPESCGRGFTGANCGYNNFWVDPGTKVVSIGGEKRTSIITSPANGRLPPMKPEAQKAMAARLAAFRTGGAGPTDGPEVRSLGERCILSFGSSAGPPMLPLLYNNNYQIVQTPDRIVILVEMVHDARIVRMNAKEHLPSNIRLWMGDSIGHWDGDTLVIETTNFRKEVDYRGDATSMKVTERLKRIGPTQIDYQFTVENPAIYNEPWSGELAFNKTNDNIYEYACHEGNYALPGILAGARESEREAAARK